MTVFRPGTAVVTNEPVVVVDAGLKPGPHTFQLVVVDDQGNMSSPARHTILILKPGRLTRGKHAGKRKRK